MINQPKRRDRSKLGATTTDTPGVRLDVSADKPGDKPAGKRTAKTKKPTAVGKKKAPKK